MVIDTMRSQIYAGIVFLFISFLFIAPILAANIDYIDDSGRKAAGYTSFLESGRFGIEAIDRFLTFSLGVIPDVGILFQVLSIVVLAATGWMFYVFFYRDLDKKKTIVEYIIAATLVINPFILANLSFRFDSLGMIVAYFLAVAAAIVFCRLNPSRNQKLLGGLLVFMAAATYQPMVTVTIALIGVFCLIDFFGGNDKKHRHLVKNLSASIVVTTTSILAYLVLFKLTQSEKMNNDNRASIVPFDASGVNTVLQNIQTVGDFLHDFYIGTYAIMGLFTAFVIVSITIALTYVLNYQRTPLPLLFALLLIAAAVIGPFVLLENPLTSMRTLAASGLLVTFFAVPYTTVMSAGPRLYRIPIVLLAITLLYGFTFSYIYGAALANQREYDTTVKNAILSSIDENYQTAKKKNIYIGHGNQNPDSVKIAYKKRPILKRMNVSTSNDLWYMKHTIVSQTQGLDIHTLAGALSCTDVVNDVKLVRQGVFFDEYESDNAYVFWLNKYQDGRTPYCPT